MNLDTSCILLQNINKYFDDKQVLCNVSLEIPKGSIYGLLGPSGCGKTTTVKIMSGILTATSGDAWVLDQKMPNLDIMNKIGYMAQSDALYTSLTGKENLAFFGQLYGLKGKELNQAIEQVLELVNLKSHLGKPVGIYSGGMKRRLSLAVALLHQPEILILDEPTVGIDPLLRQSIWDEFYLMAKKGITLLVTTHVMDEAEKCSHLSMMRNGTILASGSPSKIIADSNKNTLEEAFILYSKGGEDNA